MFAGGVWDITGSTIWSKSRDVRGQFDVKGLDLDDWSNWEFPTWEYFIDKIEVTEDQKIISISGEDEFSLVRFSQPFFFVNLMIFL